MEAELGCQNLLQAATCHLPTRNPALPSPYPSWTCLIKWDLVGTAGTSATGRMPQPNKGSPVEEGLAPGCGLVMALLAQAFTGKPSPPTSLGESVPRGTHLRKDLAPQVRWQLRSGGAEAHFGAGPGNAAWTHPEACPSFGTRQMLPEEAEGTGAGLRGAARTSPSTGCGGLRPRRGASWALWQLLRLLGWPRVARTAVSPWPCLLFQTADLRAWLRPE